MELNYDFIYVHDGSLADSEISLTGEMDVPLEPYISTGNVMTVRMFTDNTVVSFGFQAQATFFVRVDGKHVEKRYALLSHLSRKQ